MIHSVDPRQDRLFDPFQGIIPPAGRTILADGWQGAFRHAILEVMPVGQLAQHFSDSAGAPTEELYSMAALVFLADFFGWDPQEAIEAYIFRVDVQDALDLEPGATLCTRTLERHQQLARDKERRLAGRRVEGSTEVFRERYAPRSGIESTNSGLKDRLGLGRLRARGRGSVFRVILHKVAGWNILRAASSETLRAWVKTQVAQTLKGSEMAPIGEPRALVLRVGDSVPRDLGAPHDDFHGFRPSPPPEQKSAAAHKQSSVGNVKFRSVHIRDA